MSSEQTIESIIRRISSDDNVEMAARFHECIDGLKARLDLLEAAEHERQQQAADEADAARPPSLRSHAMIGGQPTPAPDVRAEAMEEVAKICDAMCQAKWDAFKRGNSEDRDNPHVFGMSDAAGGLAAAIRDRIAKEPTAPAGTGGEGGGK